MTAKSSHGMVRVMTCLPEDGFEKQEDGSYVIHHPYKSYTFPNLITALDAMAFAVHHESFIRNQIADGVRFKKDAPK